MKNREERLNYIENKLHQCEVDLQRLEQMSSDLTNIIDNAEELSEYYANEYMDDYENADKFENNYEALNQDSIWDVLSDQHIEKVRLLKKLINSIES
ncbi:MAG: DUF4298 domain-containing protein [Petrimonas sp.]|jgi:DNA repair exonuclease SbcCD ATPase subunit|nr:MAG: hypothetical protein BWZ00_00690 [Bacteroidetes bacterium ADurb.BinA174]